MESRVGVDRHLVVAEVVRLDALLYLLFEDVEVHLLRRGKLRSIDFRKLGERCFSFGVTARQVRRRDGRQPVVVFVTADGRREYGTLAEPRLPVFFKQRVQSGDFVGDGGKSEERERGEHPRRLNYVFTTELTEIT